MKNEKTNNSIPNPETKSTSQQSIEYARKLAIHETLSNLPYTEFTQENFPKIKKDIDKSLLDMLWSIAGLKTQIPTIDKYDIKDIEELLEPAIKASQKLKQYCDIFGKEIQTLPLAYKKIADIIHKIKATTGNILFAMDEKTYTKEFKKHILETSITCISEAKNQIQESVFNAEDIYKTSQYSIYQTTQKILEEKEYSIQKNNITIENSIPLDKKIHSYQDIYTSVIENLISNAIKFSKLWGKIIIWIEKETPENITFYIEDNGKGIPEWVDVFETGYTTQGNEWTKGTGLWLKLCKTYIDKVGGKITHTSWTDGKWTRFSFTLPKTLE